MLSNRLQLQFVKNLMESYSALNESKDKNSS
jgi:hypothetical protein